MISSLHTCNIQSKYNVLQSLQLLPEDDLLLYVSQKPGIYNLIHKKQLELLTMFQKFTKYADRIKLCFFRFIRKKDFILLIHQILPYKIQCINKETFMGHSISQIPKNYIYKVLTWKNREELLYSTKPLQYYVFDLRELASLFKNNNYRNPYTSIPFSITQLREINYLFIKHHVCPIQHETTPVTSFSSTIATFFIQLNRWGGGYSDITKFILLSTEKMIDLIRKCLTHPQFRHIRLYRLYYDILLGTETHSLREVKLLFIEIINELIEEEDTTTRALLFTTLLSIV